MTYGQEYVKNMSSKIIMMILLKKAKIKESNLEFLLKTKQSYAQPSWSSSSSVEIFYAVFVDPGTFNHVNKSFFNNSHQEERLKISDKAEIN